MDTKLWIEIAVLLVGMATAWSTMREQLRGVREDAADSARALHLAQRRLDEHERRITVVERDESHLSRQLDAALARIEAQITAIHARLDGLLVEFAARTTRSE